MFAPPPELETETFTAIPDELKRTGQHSEWSFGKANRNMHSFLEGPTVDRDGSLLVSDIPFGRVFRVSPTGRFEQIIEYDGEPNGLAIHKDGCVHVADHKNGLMKLDPKTRKVTTVLGRHRREGFKGLNDVLYDTSGNLYFTDQGQTGLQDPTGLVYRLRAEGPFETVLDGCPSPNGLVFNRDETQLFVAMTRANCVWRAPLMLNDTASKVGVFVQMSGGVGPDGMALDDDGNLAVCHAGLGAVWLFSPLGEPLARVNSCAGLMTTNCAYGGPDNRTLYITESDSGQILTARLDTPGRAMFAHMD